MARHLQSTASSSIHPPRLRHRAHGLATCGADQESGGPAPPVASRRRRRHRRSARTRACAPEHPSPIGRRSDHQPRSCLVSVRTRLHIAHRFHFHRPAPAETGSSTSRRTRRRAVRVDNLAQATGRASVFVPNPVVALGRWQPLLTEDGRPAARVPAEAYCPVRLLDLEPSGVLEGTRVSTALTRDRVRRRNFDFRCLSHQAGFEEVMAYHHLDRAIHTSNRWAIAASARSSRSRSGQRTGHPRRQFVVRSGARSSASASVTWTMRKTKRSARVRTLFRIRSVPTLDSRRKRRPWARIRRLFRRELLRVAKDESAACAAERSDDLGQHPQPGQLRPTAGAVRAPRRRDDHIRKLRSLAARRRTPNGEIWSATLWDIWNALGRARADHIIVRAIFSWTDSRVSRKVRAPSSMPTETCIVGGT